MLALLIKLIGIICIIRAFRSLYVLIKIHTTKLNKQWMQKFGPEPWAIVTGCTGGIGKSFTEKLAQLGFNIVLVARNQVQMDQISNQLQNNYKIKCRKIMIDFEKATPDDYKAFQPVVKDINLRLLVNNVGFAILKHFTDHTSQQINNQLKVNVYTTTILSRQILPHLLKNQQNDKNSKSKSGIINLSSMGIYIPNGAPPIYLASKAYDDLFSRSLAAELQSKVDVLSVRPGIVSTPSTNFSKDLLSCSPMGCVKGSLKALGIVQYTEGSLYHNIQALVISLFPEKLLNMVAKKKSQEVIATFKKQK